MAVLQYKTLSNRTVAALSVERDTVFWDRDLTGFGVRVYPSGGKVFVAQTRGPDGPNKPNKPRRITVGRHPVLSAEQARQRAALIIARVKAGEDPVPLPLPAKYAGGPTVADLANRYLEEHVAVRCKPKTQRTARSVVNRHIVPALGKLPIAAVERRHVMALHESLCETPAMANMAVETLSHMYALARGWDMAPEDCDDPCEFIPMTTKGAKEMRAAFAKTILVVDEGSLASTVQARDLLRIANELRMPRVVLVGDAKQLDAVDAGKPFAQLQAAGMKTATMDEIMRQRDPALKEAVEASLKGDIGRAFEKLGGNVAEVKPDNIAGAVAARWLRLGPEARENTGVMAPSHELRQAINGHIRERLDREGRIHGPAMQAERLVSRGYPAALARDFVEHVPEAGELRVGQEPLPFPLGVHPTGRRRPRA